MTPSARLPDTLPPDPQPWVNRLTLTVLTLMLLYGILGIPDLNRDAMEQATDYVNPLNRFIWLGLLALAGPVAFVRWRAVLALMRSSWALLLLYAYFAASVGWALDVGRLPAPRAVHRGPAGALHGAADRDAPRGQPARADLRGVHGGGPGGPGDLVGDAGLRHDGRGPRRAAIAEEPDRIADDVWLPVWRHRVLPGPAPRAALGRGGRRPRHGGAAGGHALHHQPIHRPAGAGGGAGAAAGRAAAQGHDLGGGDDGPRRDRGTGVRRTSPGAASPTPTPGCRSAGRPSPGGPTCGPS